MLSTLCAHGVQKHLTRLPGVKKAEVNYVAGSATVTYDDTVTDVKAIKAKVHECGYHCSGEVLPKHVCAPDDPPSEAVAVEHPAPAPKGAAIAHEMGHGP